MSKKYSVKNSYSIVAKKKARQLDFYVRSHAGEEFYLFTRKYSTTCWETCKSGVPINTILHGRRDNQAFMNLSKHLNHMMPYFVDYYELEVA